MKLSIDGLKYWLVVGLDIEYVVCDNTCLETIVQYVNSRISFYLILYLNQQILTIDFI